ncbi:MAG: UDP-glucose 4-epimerase GalE [Clostridia bacterium]|nr:UDP-glucose 4-epimerase GalE [Clostridia bacterium]
MNVLVTGGAGYIGSHICAQLCACGHTPVILDDFSNAKPDIPARLQQLTGQRPVVYRGDVRDAALLDHVFAAAEIGAVIHTAGKKAVGESVTDPQLYYENNVHGLLALTKAMAVHGVFTLVFSSSATVYSETNPVPYREGNAVLAGTSPYGRTKLIAEWILKDLAAADARWRVALLRYFNPIGADPSGLIGDDPAGVPNNLMPYICQVAAGVRPELTVFGNDYPTADGTCERDYIHVSDLAAGHIQALEYLAAHAGVLEVNLGTGQPVSVLGLIETFIKATGQPVPYRIGPRRAGDIPAYYAAVEKAKTVLGFEAACSVEQMCCDAWRFAKNSYGGI